MFLGSSKVKIKKIYLYALPLLLVAGFAYSSLSGGSEPDYVVDAVKAVSNKMSYNYGPSKCKASQRDVGAWSISCDSRHTPAALAFSVLPSEKAPYEVATSFYLVAENEVTKKSSNEGLLSYLMINTDVKAGESSL